MSPKETAVFNIFFCKELLNKVEAPIYDVSGARSIFGSYDVTSLHNDLEDLLIVVSSRGKLLENQFQETFELLNNNLKRYNDLALFSGNKHKENLNKLKQCIYFYEQFSKTYNMIKKYCDNFYILDQAKGAAERYLNDKL